MLIVIKMFYLKKKHRLFFKHEKTKFWLKKKLTKHEKIFLENKCPLNCEKENPRFEINNHMASLQTLNLLFFSFSFLSTLCSYMSTKYSYERQSMHEISYMVMCC
jgi:hypothetical protein